jgi:hypothetical protein
MEPNHQRPEDELNDLERRLASWRPAGAGLDADAMLFAAGVASGRAGRRVWAAAACVLAVVAVSLGVWGGIERSGRLELARQLAGQPPPPPVPASPPEEPPSPGSYLTARSIVLERGVEAWVALPPTAHLPAAPESPEPTTLRSWRRDRLLDP